MDKNTNNWKEFTLGNPQVEPPQRVDRKGKRRRLLLFILTVILVLAGVAVSILWQRGSFDGLRRSVMYASAEKDENGCAQLYSYPVDSTASFAALDGSLLYVSQTRLQVIDADDTVLYGDTVQYLQPAVSGNGEQALVYDVGGTVVNLMQARGLVWQKKMEGEILSACLSDSGYSAVVYHKRGYKAAVSVLDAAGEQVFAFYSADRFLMNAAVSRDGKTVAVVSMGQEDGVFTSYLTVYRLTSEESLGGCALPHSMIYALDAVKDGFCAVGDEGVFFVADNGTLRASYHYGEAFLRRAVIHPEGEVILLLGRYRSGTQAELMVIDDKGDEAAVLSVNSDVLSLDTAGRYVGVLFSDSFRIYDKELKEQAVLSGSGDCKAALMRPDGSAVIAGGGAARLYLP